MLHRKPAVPSIPNCIIDANTNPSHIPFLSTCKSRKQTNHKPSILAREILGGGFIGALLTESGYFVVFADVDKNLIKELNTHNSYVVHILAEKERKEVIRSFSGALSQKAEVPHAIASPRTRLITTAVGPTILEKIAPCHCRGPKEATLSKCWRSQRHRLREHGGPDANTQEVCPKPSLG